jgi:hypothetical protein
MNKLNSRLLPLYAILIAMGLLAVGCNRDDKQAKQSDQTEASADPAQQVQPKQLSSLESLVAPIALYPDPLLAELLVASTYPLEVVQAARWVDSKPDLNTLKDKDWDASVMRLVDVPQILKQMSDHLDWTTQLGNTFLAKPDEVMNAIQGLRRRAKQNGFLKDTPEQKVSTKMEEVRQIPAAGAASAATVQPAVYKQEVVYIEPAKSDTLYVPQYQPQAAYSASLSAPPGGSGDTTAYAANPVAASNYYPTSAPTTNSSGTDWMTFGLGAVAGGLLTWGIMEWSHNNSWNSYYGGRYYPPVSHYYGGAVCRYGNCWNGGNVGRNNVNVNRNVNISGNEVNVGNRTFNQDKLASMKTERQGWTHDTRHREGVKYPEGIKDKMGQINRPGAGGNRPGVPQTLPANIRGLDGAGGRPSADQVRESLSKGSQLRDSGLKDKAANRPNLTRPETGDVRQRRGGGEAQRPKLPESLRDSGARDKAKPLNAKENRPLLQDKAKLVDRGNNAGGRERIQQKVVQPRKDRPQQPAARPNISQSRDQERMQNLPKREKPASRPQPPTGGGLGQRLGGGGGGFGNRAGGGGFANRAGGVGGGGLANRVGGGGGGGFANRAGGGGGGGFANRAGGGGGGGRLHR